MYTYRYSEIIHSYTFELGFHTVGALNHLEPESNTTYQHQSNEGSVYKLVHTNPFIDETKVFCFEEQHYQSEGVSILVSLLDCLELNPYSRVPNTEFKTLA